MSSEHVALISLGILLIAFLYSSVGHAGASGYIAVMTLLAVPAHIIKPLALTLNILVAAIGSWQFYRAGHFNWKLFWPFALFSIPLAFVGGYVNLPIAVFKVLVGAVLVASGARLLIRPGDEPAPRAPSLSLALGAGGALGLLAGLTGTGGGIFLTPLLVLTGWARIKTAAASSAAFILVNSLAGLLGNLSATRSFPSFGALPVAAAILGGLLGSWCGSRRFPQEIIRRLLAIVLAIAGLKLILLN